jgi:3-hydroxyacyl-CoA dehydrogenase
LAKTYKETGLMNTAEAAGAAAVASTRHDDILVVTIDNPPANALGVDVRRGLMEAIEAADADPAVKAVVLLGAGRNFLGGADIREFGKPPQAPALPDVCNRIEACSKPVVAAIHGAALGGGLEVALGAHYRVAHANARLGLPEELLGHLPGAGGTQRTPRLIGAAAALELMLSGRHIGAREALKLGLVDKVEEGDDPVAAGLAYARELIASNAAPRRTSEGTALADRPATLAAIDAARADTG